MARGKRWTESEIKLLMEMVKEGKSIDEIIRSGKFPNRTSMAIQNAVKRLSFDSQKKIFIDGQIREAEIVGLETIVARYVDAFNKICDLTQYRKEDLERFRIIFQAAWKYRELFREYEKLEDLERRVKSLENLLAEIKEQRTKATVSEH
jgi:Arc/MetJ-type ribon-helix-helix transcriptional regulator